MHRWSHRVALTAIALITGQTVVAQAPVYSDDEIKAQFVKARTFCNAEFITGSYRLAFEMAGNDTNRYVRVLSELAAENTNQTRSVINQFFCRRLPASIPFLYSYATNATYGAEALKAILAIEGVTSNSLAAAQCYLSTTNFFTLNCACDRSKFCQAVLKCVFSDSHLADYRATMFNMARDYNRFVNVTSPNCVDIELCLSDPSYKFTKRRIAELRIYTNNVCRYFHSLPTTAESYGRRIHVFEYQTNYLANAINELVAYPEANLPE